MRRHGLTHQLQLQPRREAGLWGEPQSMKQTKQELTHLLTASHCFFLINVFGKDKLVLGKGDVGTLNTNMD